MRRAAGRVAPSSSRRPARQRTPRRRRSPRAAPLAPRERGGPDAVGLDSPAAISRERRPPPRRRRCRLHSPTSWLDLAVFAERDDDVDHVAPNDPEISGAPQPVSATSSVATSWRYRATASAEGAGRVRSESRSRRDIENVLPAVGREGISSRRSIACSSRATPQSSQRARTPWTFPRSKDLYPWRGSEGAAGRSYRCQCRLAAGGKWRNFNAAPGSTRGGGRDVGTSRRASMSVLGVSGAATRAPERRARQDRAYTGAFRLRPPPRRCSWARRTVRTASANL